MAQRTELAWGFNCVWETGQKPKLSRKEMRREEKKRQEIRGLSPLSYVATRSEESLSRVGDERKRKNGAAQRHLRTHVYIGDARRTAAIEIFHGCS